MNNNFQTYPARAPYPPVPAPYPARAPYPPVPAPYPAAHTPYPAPYPAAHTRAPYPVHTPLSYPSPSQRIAIPQPIVSSQTFFTRQPCYPLLHRTYNPISRPFHVYPLQNRKPLYSHPLPVDNASIQPLRSTPHPLLEEVEQKGTPNVKYTVKGKIKKERLFQCKLCSKMYISKQTLKVHYESKHQSQKNKKHYHCELCDYTSENKFSLKKHIYLQHTQNHIMYNCPIPDCTYQTKQKCHLNEHLAYKHNRGTQVFKCTHCDYSTKYHSCIKRHMKRHMDSM